MAKENLNVNGEVEECTVVPIVVDGARLFRALSYLYGTQDRAMEVFLGVIEITQSILIPGTVQEDRKVVPRLGRASTWESVLRQASYQSLTKYTGYTDSLDEKIQRDQILWSKILSAIVQRTNKQDGDINVKTGTLVDEPSGNFEFRREKSIQNCSPSTTCIDNSKLLAVWKIQRIKPNHLVVRVKIPMEPPTEDTYQYTPSMGLKLQNSKDIPVNQPTYAPEIVEIPKKNKTMAFPEQVQVKKHPVNVYKGQQSQERPITLYYVPTDMPSLSGHLSFPQTGNIVPNRDLIAQQNTKDRYGLNSQTVKTILSEFQPDVRYEGFLPSMGPTENPFNFFKSTPAINQYRPELKPNKATTPIRGTFKTYKQSTPPNFIPSTHFVQYSEQDPFYISQNTQTEQIPTKGLHFIDSKFPYKDAYTEMIEKDYPMIGTKIPNKETYSESFKFPPKGSYWESNNYAKEIFVNTGRPFELTSIKEPFESPANYHSFTTPKGSTPNYLGNSYTQPQKYPVQISTQEPEFKYPSRTTTQETFNPLRSSSYEDIDLKFGMNHGQIRKNPTPKRKHHPSVQQYQTELSHTTQTISNVNPLIITTKNSYKPVHVATQETLQRYPTPVTSTELPSHYHYVMSSTPPTHSTSYTREPTHRTTVAFPTEVITTAAPHRHSIRVTTEEPYIQETKSEEVIQTPVKIISEEKIIESINLESDELRNRVPSSTPISYSRRRQEGIGLRRKKPVRKTESQESSVESKEEVIEPRNSTAKHPTSINQQLLEIDLSKEKESSVETGTNNISSESESTDEIRETTTTTQPTTTASVKTRKYLRKTNRNWNRNTSAESTRNTSAESTRNSVTTNRNKTRGANYFKRWGDRVRSTTELPVRVRTSTRVRDSSAERTISTTTTTTAAPTTIVTRRTTHFTTTIPPQSEESSEDSEVFESQTVASIEIAPSEFHRSTEQTTITTKDEPNSTSHIVTQTTVTDTTTTPYPTTVEESTTEQKKFNNKTPEEIVNELTALGLKNVPLTDEITTEPQANPSSIPLDIISKLQSGQYSNHLDENETSLVVNRVSKSVSFKTSRGLPRRLVHPTNIIPVL